MRTIGSKSISVATETRSPMRNRQTALKRLCFVGLVLFGSAGYTQYRLVPGQTDDDGCVSKTPAKICLGESGVGPCYSPQSTKDYVFGLEPAARTIGRLDGQPLILFSAMFSGCGSGTLTDYSLLTTQRGEFVNLLPRVGLTNQSELRAWQLPQISELPVLATADFLWDFDAKETHFATHRYQIAIYAFDKESKRYIQRLSYKTNKKYEGLDEANEIKVLELERLTILSRLSGNDRNAREAK
jgi:hypothetical protein